jgi:hypothetical protein
MDSAVSVRYRKNAWRLLSVGLILLLVLTTRLLPEAGWTEYAFSAIAASLFILFLFLSRIAARAEKKRPIRTAILLVVFANGVILSLIVVHAVKLGAMNAGVPEGGTARLRFTYEESVYSQIEGFVGNMDTVVYVGKARVENGGSAPVDLDGPTNIRCETSFMLGEQTYAGEQSANVRITPGRLRNGYQKSIAIPCGGDTNCVVKIVATYEPTFWEVLLH